MFLLKGRRGNKEVCTHKTRKKVPLLHLQPRSSTAKRNKPRSFELKRKKRQRPASFAQTTRCYTTPTHSIPSVKTGRKRGGRTDGGTLGTFRTNTQPSSSLLISPAETTSRCLVPIYLFWRVGGGKGGWGEALRSLRHTSM